MSATNGRYHGATATASANAKTVLLSGPGLNVGSSSMAVPFHDVSTSDDDDDHERLITRPYTDDPEDGAGRRKK